MVRRRRAIGKTVLVVCDEQDGLIAALDVGVARRWWWRGEEVGQRGDEERARDEDARELGHLHLISFMSLNGD